MKLYGTYPSHFTRKVRIVLQELGLHAEFCVLKNLLSIGAENFAQNPLHQLPILEDRGQTLIESDIICEYLIENYGAQSALSRYIPEPTQKYQDLKRLALMNGAMGSGVKLIRAKRSEIPQYENFTFFRQERAAIEATLFWLDQDLGDRNFYYGNRFTMLEITLISLCEWITFREIIPSLKPYKNLARFTDFHKVRPSVKSTHPSLEAM